MPLKTRILKYTNKLLLSFLFFSNLFSYSQEIIPDKDPSFVSQEIKNEGNRIKVDGVAGVVGDYIILESDIKKEFVLLETRGASTENITECQLFGKLLEDKMYAHHAIQDSIVVNEDQVREQIDQQIDVILAQIGSMTKMLEYYQMESEQELRDEMFKVNVREKLAADMQRKIVEEIEVTPEEVRQFFNKNLKQDPPIFGTELKVAQIVVIPQVTEEETEKVINRLNEFRDDCLNNGASFTTKATFYTEDPGSKRTGGKYTLNKNRPQMVREFREAAFSLQEGEISKPFKTDFGYHIVYLEKIRGQEYDVRHILLRPKVTKEAVLKAQETIEKVRNHIINGEMTFEEAAKEFSDEKETKSSGGKLINPLTQDYKFELTKMDPDLYAQIQNLKDNEVSEIIRDSDRINSLKFKLMMVTDRIDEHEANFSKDYLKIKQLAEQDKQLKAIGDWQEEKIKETYIKIGGKYRDCEFTSNWLKK